MHTAEEYLRNPETPDHLYIHYKGKRRKLFFNKDQNIIGIIAIGKRIKGYVFSDWNGIEKIFDKQSQPKNAVEINRHLIRKYQREAAKAGFTNPFIRKIQAADYNKGLYENGITTGNRIDGQIITLEAVRKWCDSQTHQDFCEAIKNHTPFHSARFNFRGYDGSLWVDIFEKDDGYHCAGDMNAGFSKEFRNCGNGYYYLLVNEQTFIGYDVD